MDTAAKTGMDAAKTASKWVVNKTTEVTDLVGNKIADKITSIGKPKGKEKAKKVEEIYIPPKKRQQIIDTTCDYKDLPRFVTKKWIKVYDQSDKSYSPNKEIKTKTSMVRSDLCNFSDAYIAVEGDIIVDKHIFCYDGPNNTAANVTAANTENDNRLVKKAGFWKQCSIYQLHFKN